MSEVRRVAVAGSHGFVGSACCEALEARGLQVVPVKTPRLLVSATEASQSLVDRKGTHDIAAQLHGVDALINCAGDPDASSHDMRRLYGANAALPPLLAGAAVQAGVERFVHVSSAVVQGSREYLDASLEHEPLSEYGRSKALGEALLQVSPHPGQTTIYRPPSVHAPTRRITQAIHRIANSPISSVVGRGDARTPQAHISNVANALSYLATTPLTPPLVVIHPWEGWTTNTFLQLFSQGDSPFHIPWIAGPPIRKVLSVASRQTRLSPNARRLEILWFGQDQEESWLSLMQWSPVANIPEWEALVEETRRMIHSTRTTR